MADERPIVRYRRWYRKLLRCYPRPYRERFAESMEQTFHDLCRERSQAGKWLIGFVLWIFVETAAGIVRNNVRFFMVPYNVIVRIAVIVGLILLVPLWGNYNFAGCNWGFFDFVFMGTLLFGTGLTYELIARKGGTIAYRAAVGVACATGLLLVWVNGAVGIIGDEVLANAIFLGVLVVGILGAFLAHFRPRGMARALVATAAAQALVPLIALTWVPEDRFAPGVMQVMGLNAVFVALWLVSALLFHRAAPPSSQLEANRGASTA